MLNKTYKVLSFSVPSNHSTITEWHFETPQPGPLGNQIEQSLNELAKEGWKVIGIQALQEGQYRLPLDNPRDVLSPGYGITSSILVFLEKDANG